MKLSNNSKQYCFPSPAFLLGCTVLLLNVAANRSFAKTATPDSAFKPNLNPPQSTLSLPAEKQRPTIDVVIPQPRRDVRLSNFHLGSLEHRSQMNMRHTEIIARMGSMRESMVSRINNPKERPLISSNSMNSHDHLPNNTFSDAESGKWINSVNSSMSTFDMMRSNQGQSNAYFYRTAVAEYQGRLMNAPMPQIRTETSQPPIRVITSLSEVGGASQCTRSASHDGVLLDRHGAILVDNSRNPFPSGPQTPDLLRTDVRNMTPAVPSQSSFPSFNNPNFNTRPTMPMNYNPIHTPSFPSNFNQIHNTPSIPNSMGRW